MDGTLFISFGFHWPTLVPVPFSGRSCFRNILVFTRRVLVLSSRRRYKSQRQSLILRVLLLTGTPLAHEQQE